jgi:hypothetical protein
MIRSYLPNPDFTDEQRVEIIDLFQPSDRQLPNARDKQRWLNTLMGMLSQAQKARLSGVRTKAVYRFLGRNAYPFLRKLNNAGIGGPSALPADQAVLLIHSLMDDLSLDQIDTLMDNLLLRFPNKRPACKKAVEDLTSLGLRAGAICQIVVLLRDIAEMEDISQHLVGQLRLHMRSIELIPKICNILGIVPVPTPEQRYITCLRMARQAVIPKDLDTNMVCVMYDPATRGYFTGFNATQRSYQQGPIPQSIWTDIPTRIDVERYSFGRGCAEVHCASQAFAERQRQNITIADLKGCVLASWHPKESRERPACAGCVDWLTPTGAFFKKSA